jgi:hypothetical protein
MKLFSFDVYIRKFHGAQFGNPQAVAKHQKQNAIVSHRIARIG